MTVRNWAASALQAALAAEEAERRFNERVRTIRNETDPTIRYGVDVAVGYDPDAQGAISDNRWHISRATMYGQLAVAQRLGLLITELRLLREDLRRDDSSPGARARTAAAVDELRGLQEL